MIFHLCWPPVNCWLSFIFNLYLSCCCCYYQASIPFFFLFENHLFFNLRHIDFMCPASCVQSNIRCCCVCLLSNFVLHICVLLLSNTYVPFFFNIFFYNFINIRETSLSLLEKLLVVSTEISNSSFLTFTNISMYTFISFFFFFCLTRTSSFDSNKSCLFITLFLFILT